MHKVLCCCVYEVSEQVHDGPLLTHSHTNPIYKCLALRAYKSMLRTFRLHIDRRCLLRVYQTAHHSDRYLHNAPRNSELARPIAHGAPSIQVGTALHMVQAMLIASSVHVYFGNYQECVL